MKTKKPYWEKKGKPISGKIKSSPLSFATDDEIRYLLTEITETTTEVIEGFVAEDIGVEKEEMEKMIKLYLYSEMKTKRGNWSKGLRIYLIKKVIKTTTNLDLKKRMKERLMEENHENI